MIHRALFYAAWLVVIYFALYLASIALSYFSFDLEYGFLKAKQHMLSNQLWLVFFFVHLFFGAVATLSGWPLFFSKIMPFRSTLHKRLGQLYIYSILFFTGPTGLYLAFFAEGGVGATFGFLMMCFCWMFPTYRALYYVIQKDFQQHYRWMIRSYAMTLSGVTLRLFMPFGSKIDILSESTVFVISSWVFLLNVLLAELLILLNKPREASLLKQLE
jgi:hypothetical protein